MDRLLLLAFTPFAVAAVPGDRVEVCHVPPGNAAGYHTLTIPVAAVSSHLAHGDLEGSCGNYCGLFCSTGDKCVQDSGTFDPDTGRCICSSAPVDCTSMSACLTSTGCDPALGCEYSVNVGAACNGDDNVCTADTCDAEGTCQLGPHDLAAMGGVCSGSTSQACAYDKDCPAGESCAWTQSLPRFIDNGNGTVTDQRTCLMWEKKNNDGYSVHWVERHFSWSLPGSSDLTGTVKTELLDALNEGAGFAGFNDWCLPTSAGDDPWPTGQDPELESTRTAGCTSGPCTDPLLGPTETGGYWSASTCEAVPFPPGGVWVVSFSELPPVVSLGSKENGVAYARAVRSRSCASAP